MALDQGSRLIIEWKESGGPPVQPPARRGFGTTIIERSIPFDLNGDAELRFDLLGVQARFVVPANYVQIMSSAAVPRQIVADKPVRAATAGTALIVEDNLIIAHERGSHPARTRRAPRRDRGSVAEALKSIDG